MEAEMIELRHPDGDRLREGFPDQWFQDKLKRLKSYWELGDRERAIVETQHMLTALEDERIPEAAYFLS
jgi:esterase/lipase superfamily enzyme